MFLINYQTLIEMYYIFASTLLLFILKRLSNQFNDNGLRTLCYIL